VSAAPGGHGESGRSTLRRSHRPSLRSRGACLVSVLVLASSSASAQDASLEGASVDVVVAPGTADASVVVRYTVVPSAANTPLRLRAIPFFGLVPGGVSASADGTAVPVTLGSVGERVDGTVTLPRSLPGDRAVQLELRYAVTGAVARDGESLDIRVPVLLLLVTPASSADDFFAAELRVPAGITVTESFPTVPRRHETVEGEERYALALQVVPSLLRWRGTEGAAPWLSFEAGVDLALIVVILGFALLGARALARSA